MPIASRLSQHINKKGILCQPLHHSRSDHFAHAVELAGAVPELSIKAIPLIDKSGPVIAVIPFLADLDLELLNSTLGRQFQVLPEMHANKIFKDCEPGVIPALGMAYGLAVLVEADVLEFDHCFAASGCASTLLKIPGHALKSAMQGAIKVRVSKWPQVGALSVSGARDSGRYVAGRTAPGRERGVMSLDSVAKKLQSVYKLPPMPETAVRIMHLTSDPDSDVVQLSGLIERDPSLSAQIMRYARSALFNYPGELTSIKDAVNRVLGFDRVSQLAMGIAASKAFTIPSDGLLGLKRFWQHALYNGVLSQALSVMANPELELNDKDAYLAGLLHNFGLLLIGHLFPPEFKMLNKLRETEPEASMQEIEKQVFGMGGAQEFISLGHGSMGAILLKLWDLPESTIKSAAMHQNINYEGDNAAYVKLVQLANYYLAKFDVGDEPMDIDPEPLLEALGLEEEKAMKLAEATIERCRSLDGMVAHIAA